MRARHLVLAAAAWCAAQGAAFAASPTLANFKSLDGTLLSAHVFLPIAPPKGTVVALHGCGGLFAVQGARKGELNARHQGMADLLVAEGYAVVFPDSLTPRGEKELCTQRTGQRAVGQVHRRADALAAIAWAAAQPWTPSQRVALLGWSHGGSAVLGSTDARRGDVAAQGVRPAVAVAFYPGCSAALQAGYRPSTRLVLMLGEKDDWTAPGPCVELGRAANAEVNLYEGSYHDFDNPVGKVRLRHDVPNGVNPGQGVHVGANPQARAQSYGRLLQLLGEAFQR
ncbi:MAG: dienelactone hydrolase family protein [Pseudomonadota bacterium]